MIELKNTIFITPSFKQVMQTLQEAKGLPMKLAYNTYRFVKLLAEHLKTYEDLRIALCKELGDFDEKEQNYTFKDTHKEFVKRFEDLLNIKFTLDIPKLEYCSELCLSPVEISLLEDVLDFSTLEATPIEPDST